MSAAPIPIVLPGGGSRDAETLIILGVLAGGAYLLWRRGVFSKPSGVPAVAAAAVPPPAPAPVPAPVMTAPKRAESPMAKPGPQIPGRDYQCPPGKIPGIGGCIMGPTPAPAELSVQTAALTAAKPPPVTTPIGAVAAASGQLAPSPFGKTITVVKRPAAPAAAPTPPSLPAAIPPPKPVSLVAPVSAALAKPVATKPAFALGGVTVKPLPLSVGFKRA